MSLENIKPYFQGQVDTFCAIYATINAFKLCTANESSSGIDGRMARKILNDSLFSLADDKEYFKQVLNIDTDYIRLVDEIILRYKTSLLLHVEEAFEQGLSGLSSEKLWARLSAWHDLSPQNVSVFRFLRFLPFSDKAYVRHWTSSKNLDQGRIELFDCSLESSGAKFIPKELILVDYPTQKTNSELFYIDPNSIRLLAPL